MKPEELKQILNEATPAPWTWRVPGYLCNKYIDEGGLIIPEQSDGFKIDPANCRAIAVQRNIGSLLCELWEACEEWSQAHVVIKNWSLEEADQAGFEQAIDQRHTARNRREAAIVALEAFKA